MVQVLVLGSHAQSFRCFKYLVENSAGAQIVGLVPHQTQPTIRDDQDARAIARAHDIPVLELADLEDLHFDLGISLMFDRVLPGNLVARPARGFVNIHLGPLPRFRGSNSVYHALRLARRDNWWTFGVTLHYMIEKLDAGPIIDLLECPIYEDDTALSLHTRACDLVPQLFERNVHRLLQSPDRLPNRQPGGKSYFFKKGSINHEIDLSLPPQELFDELRALSFPGKGKAYAVVGGRKLYLSLDES